MDDFELMMSRHSVRQYKNKPIENEKITALNEEIERCNQEGDLHIQLIVNEPKAFDGFMAHYGKFSGVTNYIALIGKKGADLDEKCGYYGERLVLLAQQLGLNTCWVAMSYSKIKGTYKVENGEKLTVVIAVGYGKNHGVAHKSKLFDDVAKYNGEAPDWFVNGVDASLLAPTAINQQKFTLKLDGNKVLAKAGLGFYAKLDLGIVKYHFELGAGKENFEWA